MTTLPITRVTLYKHGVGYFERRAQLQGDAVSLSFRIEEMNDVLKSLTAIDWGNGQVLGVEYPSPQTRDELLAGCSIRLGDGRSMQDLLVSLRGRRVRLLLDQGESLTGVLVGIDDAPQEQALATALVSVLLDQTSQVQTVPLGRVQGVEILDAAAAGDLRFFLDSSLTQEVHRQVTVRLTPGEHDLFLSYVAPAPSWRVSYRLVVEDETQPEAQQPAERRALLMGWGIFDNRLEEDLQGISLSLVAGMPLSFVYDLMTPITPERPHVADESRVAPGPVTFAQAQPAAPKMAMMMDSAAEAGMLRAPAPARRGVNAAALEEKTVVAASGTDMGELFEYTIATPVTVGRGQSAMAPIVSARLACRKDLLYNGGKLPLHPVATLRLRNSTGLTLERGPVTVIDNGGYAGEAILPLTAIDGEIVTPYAVELGITVREESAAQRQLHRLHISGQYLLIEEYDVRTRRYQVNNTTAKELAVLIEHPRNAQYDLVTPDSAQEQTADHLRFAVRAPAHGETALVVKEQRLLSRREEIRTQSPQALQEYVKQGLLGKQHYAQINELLDLWSRIAADEQRLAQIEQERQSIYKAQEQARGNMAALAAGGKEGELRASYVEKLRSSEQQLDALAGEETRLKAEIARLQADVNARLTTLA